MPTLTKEQVLLAERRESTYHSVIDVLEYRTPQIAVFNRGYNKLTDNQEQQRFVKDNFGFLADDIGALDDFTLSPLELIAIWSKAHEMMSYYPRKTGLGMILPTAYATKGAQNPGWKEFSKYMLESYELPEDVQQDKEGLLYVQDRIQQVRDSLNEISFYMNGVRDGMQKSIDLAMKSRDGDKEADEELNKLIAYSEEHQTEVLLALTENLSNGVTLTSMKLNDFLE